MANKSGKGGTCTLNAVPLILAGWDINKKANLPDATDSGTAADYEAHVVGRKGGEFTLRGWINHEANQPAILEPGTVLSTINLTTDGTLKYVIASATVMSCRDGVKIDTGETCDWEATVKINGAWTPLA
jgi:hypothetical protein